MSFGCRVRCTRPRRWRPSELPRTRQGYAVQYAIGYAPIKLRAAIIPLTQFGSMAAMPLLILGLILNTSTLVTIGIAAFGRFPRCSSC